MDYHPVVNQIKSLLDESSIKYEIFEHEEVHTSEEAARVRHGYTIDQGAKALILKVKRTLREPVLASPTPTNTSEYVMFVMPANLRLDNDKVRSVLGVKDMRFATPEEVSAATSGVLVGGVPPFGNLFGLEVYVDPKLFENERIVFNAGDRRYSIALKSEDYKSLVKLQIVDITVVMPK